MRGVSRLNANIALSRSVRSVVRRDSVFDNAKSSRFHPTLQSQNMAVIAGYSSSSRCLKSTTIEEHELLPPSPIL